MSLSRRHFTAGAMASAAEVRNIDGWYDAFQVRPGQKMYLPPAERVRIW